MTARPDPADGDQRRPPRRTSSFRVKALGQHGGSRSTASCTWRRARPTIRSERASMGSVSWRLLWPRRSIPYGAITSSTSSGTSRPGVTSPGTPAEEASTESVRPWICAVKRAEAIGDRQIFAVQTKRNSTSGLYPPQSRAPPRRCRAGSPASLRDGPDGLPRPLGDRSGTAPVGREIAPAPTSPSGPTPAHTLRSHGLRTGRVPLPTTPSLPDHHPRPAIRRFDTHRRSTCRPTRTNQAPTPRLRGDHPILPEQGAPGPCPWAPWPWSTTT